MSKNLRDLVWQHAEARYSLRSSGEGFAEVLINLLKPIVPGIEVTYYVDGECTEHLYVEVPRRTQTQGEIYLENLLEREVQKVFRVCGLNGQWFWIEAGELRVSQEQAEQIKAVLKSHLSARAQEGEL